MSFHHGGGVGIGKSLHAGMVVVADGTDMMAERLRRVLTTDPGTGVMRHADAGYPEAIEEAARDAASTCPWWTHDRGGQGRPVSRDSKVAVDLDLCKACGICIKLCPEGVFDARRARRCPVIARPEDCTACLLCELHCPDFAIEVRRPVKKAAGKAAHGARGHRTRPSRTGSSPRSPAGGRDEDDEERPVSGSECGVHGGGED